MTLTLKDLEEAKKAWENVLKGAEQNIDQSKIYLKALEEEILKCTSTA